MDDIIRQAIHDFRADLQRRHYAAHTLANYTLDLQLFFAACPQPLAQVSFQDIEQFLERQYQQDLAPTTIHRRLHALKHFFDYLVEQRRVTGNPVKPSHMVRRGRPLPKALSQDQVQQLFAKIHHPMDKALFWFCRKFSFEAICGMVSPSNPCCQRGERRWRSASKEPISLQLGGRDTFEIVRGNELRPRFASPQEALIPLTPQESLVTYRPSTQRRQTHQALATQHLVLFDLVRTG
jgi:hypothetical protein